MISMQCLTKFIFILLSISTCVKSGNVNKDENKSERIIDSTGFRKMPHDHSNHHRSHHEHHGAFPTGFQHNPQFHKKGDFQFIADREEHQEITTISDGAMYWNETTKLIPLEFINIINAHNISDLLENYIESDSQIYSVSNRFGEEASERSELTEGGAASIPTAAGCSPEITTIKLKESTDPSILYIPQCMKIERCSGCCSHPLLSCQPTQTETLTYKVMKTQYGGEKKLKLLGKEIVLVERHISCKCSCKIKEESCNNYQQYNPAECRCICTNKDEESKCYKNNNKKLWNPDLCACQCRNVLQCSTGQYFDNNECKCLLNPMRRYVASDYPEAPPIGEYDDDY